MRRVLLVLLGFGVFAGYGSAIASARWHARHGGEGGCQSRWSRGYDRNDRDDATPAVAPTPAPQQMQASPTIVVPQAAPAPTQQIFLIMPGASTVQGQPQVITVPVPAAAPAPAQAPTPAPASP